MGKRWLSLWKKVCEGTDVHNVHVAMLLSGVIFQQRSQAFSISVNVSWWQFATNTHKPLILFYLFYFFLGGGQQQIKRSSSGLLPQWAWSAAAHPNQSQLHSWHQAAPCHPKTQNFVHSPKCFRASLSCSSPRHVKLNAQLFRLNLSLRIQWLPELFVKTSCNKLAEKKHFFIN